MSETIIEQLIRPEIRALKSYHVPDASGLLKLDAMENPHAWPGALMSEWHEALAKVEANRYPDPSASALKAQLRTLMQLDKLEQESGQNLDILLGNGSDEIIQIIAMALANSERGIMAPEPAFVMYGMIAKFVGMPYHGIDLNEDFSIDIDTFVEAVKAHDPALIFLAVPNNPTGNVFELADIEQIIEASNGLVVIDEAYLAFTESDLLELCAYHDNVVVMRTLSKVGLAGLRLGFLIGRPAWLSEFDKLRLPYNINVLTQTSAEFALQHYDALVAQTRELCEERTRLFNALMQIDALEPYESEANFILVRCTGKPAKEVFEAMKASGVLVKCLEGAHPLLSSCLRLTVGTSEQNAQMLEVLRASL
ncbi:MAG: histidinol-phosphate transaminase [Oleiphilus sp.]|nr:MAG: histidinol-phosphate transaminase [Oleiphilus sp.]